MYLYIPTMISTFQEQQHTEPILLVQESDLRWALPGGWADVDISVGENTIKEVRELSARLILGRQIH